MLHAHLGRADELLAAARHAAAEASAVTPNAAGWLALGEAEYLRAQAKARPDAWAQTAATWDRLERPPLAAYCRWREAEALLAAGASRAEASEALRTAHAVAARIGARPLLQEIELLAERARLGLAAPEPESPDEERYLEAELGLTRREAEVLRLMARGYTNREIAEALVISIKTASVHVSHILAKLGAPNRREAAAIAHRVAPPPVQAVSCRPGMARPAPPGAPAPGIWRAGMPQARPGGPSSTSPTTGGRCESSLASAISSASASSTVLGSSTRWRRKRVDPRAQGDRGVEQRVGAGLVGADRDQVLLLAVRGQRAAQPRRRPRGPRA